MRPDLSPPDPDFFPTLFGKARRSALHLEMRDGYMADELFTRWLADGRPSPVAADSSDEPWMATVAEAVNRGVEVRRARVVSEPVSAYVAWEHAATRAVNIAAGEAVRWLPRWRASKLTLPGNDFWLFDEETVVWNHFTGDGEWLGVEVTDDPDAAALCAASFASVWALAIDHENYTI
ncbi:DUF6879 family protein [Streptosporangium saharense]|uniref:DUF6879 domain-containing protein n=1 Tax=Streptosporangium saharense TaxID=1706840 RepID=A0A7W7QQ79_9ACTN|nr:DUF6879 family protein [Streptosporangium saharense]MBB4917648.1 hypothetical protein [Streptosporangium saharense]